MADVQSHATNVFDSPRRMMPNEVAGMCEDTKSLKDYWGERCMLEIMKLETASTERIEKLEKSLELHIRAALSKHQELEQRLQPSGSASERYLASTAECGENELLSWSSHDRGGIQAAMQDRFLRFETTLQELRDELSIRRDRDEVDKGVNELFRREMRAEQKTALQEQAQLIEATKVGLDMNLKQGFDRLRSGIDMVDASQQGSAAALERVERLESHIFNMGHQFDASEQQIVELQQQRAHIEFTLSELHTRLTAAERAAFEVEEENSLVNRLSSLEAQHDPNSSQLTAAFSLISRLEGRLEEIEAVMSGNVVAGPDASTFQITTNPDIQKLKAAFDKTQRDVQGLAEDLLKERDERQNAFADVDNVNCIIAKAAASTIERMEQRFAERMGELTGVAGISTDDRSHTDSLYILNSSIPGEAPTVRPSPMGTPLGEGRNASVFEERITGEMGRLASLAQLQGQRLEVIDSSTKAAIMKLGEKYQAACELGTRTLLLEKAVKWLLEVGSHDRGMNGEPLSPGVRLAGTPRAAGSAPPVRRMVSVNPPMRRTSPQVFRSQSQPAMSAVHQTDHAGVSTMQGLVKFMHTTLGDAGNADPAVLTRLLQNDSQASGVRSVSSFGMASRTQSNEHLSAVPSPMMQMSAASSPSMDTMTRSTVPSLSLPATPLLLPEGQQTRSSLMSSPRQEVANRRLPLGAPASSRTGRSGAATSSSAVASAGRGNGEWQLSRSGSLPGPIPKEKMQTGTRPPAASPRGNYHWVLPRGGSGVVLQDAHSRGRAVVRPSAGASPSQKHSVKLQNRGSNK